MKNWCMFFLYAILFGVAVFVGQKIENPDAICFFGMFGSALCLTWYGACIDEQRRLKRQSV